MQKKPDLLGRGTNPSAKQPGNFFFFVLQPVWVHPQQAFTTSDYLQGNHFLAQRSSALLRSYNGGSPLHSTVS